MPDLWQILWVFFFVLLIIAIAIIEFKYQDRWELNKNLLLFLTSLVLMSVIIFGAIFVIMAPLCIFEKTIIVQPFEIDSISRQNFSGEHLANSLCFELIRIKKVKLGPDSTNAIQTTNIAPDGTSEGLGVVKLNTHIQLPPISPPSGTDYLKEYDSFQVGKLDMSGVSISLGQIVPFLKKITHNQGGAITSSFQRYGSTLCIVANYYDPDSLGEKNNAWKVCRHIKKNDSVIDDIIPAMIEDLAYQIALDNAQEYNKAEVDNYSRTWQAFKNWTQGWEAYHRYYVTKNLHDLDTASALAQEAEKFEPHYPGSYELQYNLAFSWYNIGLDFYKKGNDSEAFIAFDRVIKFNPEDSAAWIVKGNALYMRSNYNEAINAYDRALEINKRDSAAWIGKGNALYTQRFYNEAINAYDKALEINKRDSAAWIGKGNALHMQGKSEEAIKAYKKAT